MPSKIIWGEGSCIHLVELITSAKPELFIDKNIYPQFMDKIGSNIDWGNIHIVEGPPIFEDVIHYGDNSKNHTSDVVCVGGGSTIDFAKAVIAVRLFGDIENLGIGQNSGKQHQKSEKQKLICLPTTFGSGAECSRYFVLYSRDRRHKIHGKSWSLVADHVIIDSNLIRNIPVQLAVCSSFDAFIHYWETAICSGESNFLTKSLSLQGIKQIVENLEKFIEDPKNTENILSLGVLSSIAGVNISNTRTGNIHEAAGALLERSNLSHGETLYVFYKCAIRMQLPNIMPFTTKLLESLGWQNIDQLFDYWSSLFKKSGLESKISAELLAVKNQFDLSTHILERLNRDEVWNSKESPVEIHAEVNKEFLKSVYEQWDLPKASSFTPNSSE